MIIVATAKMGYGTFEAKFIPLSMVEEVSAIHVVRKEPAGRINKLSYTLLPGQCRYPLLNMIIAPYILWRTVKRTKADYILAYHFAPHFIFAYIVSRLTGVPFIVGQTGTVEEGYARNKLYGWIPRHILSKSFAFNVPGNRTRDFWILQGIDPKRIHILHSTIDTDRFVSVEGDKKYDFVFIGRLAPEKRLDRLVLAVKEIIGQFPDLRICIVGDGPMKTGLVELMQKGGVEQAFDFVGFQKDTQHWLTQAHGFVMTSESEGLPCALMEAMSCELISIIPDINNMRDVIRHEETGFLFPKQDIHELGRLMAHVMSHRDTMQELRSKAREIIVAEHSYAYAVKKWKEILLCR